MALAALRPSAIRTMFGRFPSAEVSLLVRTTCQPTYLPGVIFGQRGFAAAKAPKQVDPEKQKRIQEVREEIGRGYFGDVREFNRNKGKLFTAEASLTPVNESVAFPFISGTSLAGSQVNLPSALIGKTSLVCLGFRDFSLSQLKSFREPFEDALKNDARYQVIELSVLERWAWRLMGPLIRLSLRRQLPPQRHAQYVLVGGSGGVAFKETMGVRNKIFGYVYLVDGQGMVRWKACGMAEPQEIASMIELAKKLSARK
eukprot:comp23620_c1_seq1/m.40220 comp23620_c1_seq1/g.40220  ORF comp23620_c1_seq1/g.40220 comp23620_c1_seq1/m.40220 type:complete len:257 (-) comp23620_c1_seq1:304-1074(-)